MQSSFLFKLFPPPAFMVMPYVGLDISDDAIRCVGYRRGPHGLRISVHDATPVPAGLIDGGDIKDEKVFVASLKAFASKNNLSRVKVSLPEEKTYLFQTEVPSSDFRSIAQNIEFKLDQNVPLSAADALFQFDLMPRAVTGGALRASVSVVPRTYVEHYIGLLAQAKLSPVAFEVVPKSITMACIPDKSQGTHLIVHIMRTKMGLYIVSEGVVCFASTVPWDAGGLDTGEHESTQKSLMNELDRVYSYWISRSDVHAGISEIVVVGYRATDIESLIRASGNPNIAHSSVPDVWHNAFDVNQYVPPITRVDSLEYAVAAGLAL